MIRGVERTKGQCRVCSKARTCLLLSCQQQAFFGRYQQTEVHIYNGSVSSVTAASLCSAFSLVAHHKSLHFTTLRASFQTSQLSCFHGIGWNAVIIHTCIHLVSTQLYTYRDKGPSDTTLTTRTLKNESNRVFIRVHDQNRRFERPENAVVTMHVIHVT